MRATSRAYRRRHDFKHEREALVGGQNPYAAILSCADSRIAPEYAFDSGRGDLFVCRVAGNFANDESDRQPGICRRRARRAADPRARSRQLRRGRCGHQIAQGRQAAAGPSALAGRGHCAGGEGGIAQGGDTLGKAIRQNVIDNVAKLESATPILSAAVEQNKLKVVGGVYGSRTAGSIWSVEVTARSNDCQCFGWPSLAIRKRARRRNRVPRRSPGCVIPSRHALALLEVAFRSSNVQPVRVLNARGCRDLNIGGQTHAWTPGPFRLFHCCLIVLSPLARGGSPVRPLPSSRKSASRWWSATAPTPRRRWRPRPMMPA